MIAVLLSMSIVSVYAVEEESPVDKVVNAMLGIWKVIAEGFVAVINGILHFIGAPFEGTASVLKGWFDGVRIAVTNAFAQSPLFVGVALVLIVGFIIFYIFGRYKSFADFLSSPMDAIGGLGGGRRRSSGSSEPKGPSQVHYHTHEAPKSEAPKAPRAPKGTGSRAHAQAVKKGKTAIV